jgi:hypothetical protein
MEDGMTRRTEWILTIMAATGAAVLLYACGVVL